MAKYKSNFYNYLLGTCKRNYHLINQKTTVRANAKQKFAFNVVSALHTFTGVNDVIKYFGVLDQMIIMGICEL